MDLLRIAAALPFLVPNLERALLDALEDAYNDPCGPHALLHRTVALMRGCGLSVYTDVLVAVARKSDRSRWAVLLSGVGDPHGLFERCLAAAVAKAKQVTGVLLLLLWSSNSSVSGGTSPFFGGSKLLHIAANFMVLLYEQSGEQVRTETLRKAARLTDAISTLTSTGCVPSVKKLSLERTVNELQKYWARMPPSIVHARSRLLGHLDKPPH